MEKRRVAVTGLGALSPIGSSLDDIWDSLMQGRSGVGKITQIENLEGFSSQIAGELKNWDPLEHFPAKEVRHMDPFSLYGVVAARSAVQDSGLDLDALDKERAGVIVSTGVGGLQILFQQSNVYTTRGPRRFSPFMIPQMITNIVAGQVAIEYGFKGPNYCVTTACATATHSLGDAMRIIMTGEADVMLAGGSEAPICELGVGGFCAMRALSTRNDEPERASRPFDAERDGFVIAEGAAVLMLEELEHAKARGAHIYCEISGFGRTCDASHITAPDSSGSGAARAMVQAFTEAGLKPEDIDYINAHGTSTPLNDAGETKAIKLALGEENARNTMVSSTKSMTGHMLGAAGGMEALICALTLDKQVVAPTINYENPDPECDLDYVPNEARAAEVNACLSNSLGFGGHNGSLCLKRFQD
jgi:3-oxoacyl-[acyl-carrier-protein] synthase II